MTDVPGKSAPANARANTIPWPPILLVAALSAALGLGSLWPLPWPGQDDGPARFIGLSFAVLGIVLTAWAVASLIQHNTTVMPDRRSDTLVTSGPYRFMRNPIYLGETFMLLGAAEVTKNIWFAAAAAGFAVSVTMLQILSEERHLEARFGDAYRTYKAATRRWI